MSVDQYKQILSLPSVQQPTASANVSNDATALIGASTLPPVSTLGALESDGNIESDGNREEEEEVGTKVSFLDITDIREEGADRSSVCPTNKRIQASK